MGISQLRIFQIAAVVGTAVLAAVGFSHVQNTYEEVGHRGPSVKGSGPQIRDARKVSPFNRIVATQLYDVDVHIGSGTSVVIEAPRNLQSILTAHVQNGTLSLSSSRNYSADRRIKVHIVTPRLTGVFVSGAASMVVKDNVQTQTFRAETSGSASLRLSATTDRLEVEATGASKVTFDRLTARDLAIQASGAVECSIVGTVQNTKIAASGASKVNASSLTTGKADVSASGAAVANLHVMSSLSAEATGAGSIRYLGHPQVVKSTSGAGSVQADN